MSTTLERALKEVVSVTGRYLNPDPVRPIAIGDFGRVTNGVLRKRGNIVSWLGKRGVDLSGGAGGPEAGTVFERHQFSSKGVRVQSIGIEAGAKSVQGIPLEASFGFEVSFHEEHQFFFQTPELQFRGMKEMGIVADELVSRATDLDEDDPGFWEDDYCVVTGVYEAKSYLQAFSSSENSRFAFTAQGAGSATDLEKANAKLAFLSESKRDVVFERAYDRPAPVFLELSKVHWYVVGPKRWGITTDFNP